MRDEAGGGLACREGTTAMDIEKCTCTGDARCDGCSVGIEAGHRSARIVRPDDPTKHWFFCSERCARSFSNGYEAGASHAKAKA
jgi:hypothetical protein